MLAGDGVAELRSEIQAFYAGFGQPELLRQAFEAAVLVVPLVEDDRVPTSPVGGIDWIPAFTSVEEYARYMVARGVSEEREYRYHTLQGALLTEYAAARTEPTGVSVDCVGAAPVAFPPQLAEETTASEVEA